MSDAKAQPSAFPGDFVVIKDGSIDSRWRTRQDAATWATRLQEQSNSFGGVQARVTVDSVPSRYSTLSVEKTLEDSNH